MILRVLNQQQSQLQSPFGADVRTCLLIRKCLSIKSSRIVLHALKQKQASLSSTTSSSFMMTMEMETNQNCAEQRVKQLKRVKQRVDWQYYSHVHYRPQNSNTNQRPGLLPSCSSRLFCLGFPDLLNWILILSSLITRDIYRVSLMVWSYCCVLLPGNFFYHTLSLSLSLSLSHTHTNSEYFFDIVVDPI